MASGEFKPVAVYSRARPRRIAFLVDPENISPELVDRLFEYNYGLWGGRFNPIVPVAGGSITESYWRLLLFVDPDLVYTYTPLPLELIRRIDRELSPLEFKQHPAHFFTQQPPMLWPSFIRGQVEALAAWPLAFRQEQWLRHRSKFLTCAASYEWPPKRFVLRNFGLVPENQARPPYAPTDELLSIKDDWSEERLLEELAQARIVTFPFQGSTVESVFPEPAEQHENAYCIILGDDVQSWVYFWNRALLLSDYRRRYWHSLCIPLEYLDRPGFRGALRKFLGAFVEGSGGAPSHVDVVSFHQSAEALTELCTALSAELFAWCRPKPMQANEFPMITPGYAVFPDFTWPGTPWGPDRTTRQQATSAKAMLRTPEAVVPLERGSWMMDLRVEYRPPYHFYTNESLWWQLPRRREIPRLFVDGPARIDASRSLTVEISEKNVFELRIPKDAAVLQGVLGVGVQVELNENLEYTRREPAYQWVTSSDKGDYANGVLTLFEGLHSAGHYFAHSFWRPFFERLSRRGRDAEAERLTMIRNKLLKKRALLAQQVTAGDEASVDWLARYVLEVARHEQMADEEVTFEEITNRFHAQRESFMSQNPNFRQNSSLEGVSRDRAEATRILRRAFQGLVDAGILLQGVSVRCTTCGSRYWLEIAHVQQRTACRGCGSIITLQAESTWRYRLNSLVRNAVAFHGTIPVVLTLYELRHDAKRFFIFAPGLCLFEKYDDRGPKAEVDIVCVADGELIVGEVKQTADDFTEAELHKLSTVAQHLDAAVIVLGTLRDDARRLGTKEQRLKALVPGHMEVRTILPDAHAFEPTPHP